MATKFLEPGTDATQDLSFFASTSGTVTSATDQAHTGTRSLKGFTGSPAVAATANTKTGTVADAGFWFRFSTMPPTNPAQPLTVTQSDASSAVMAIRLRTTGILEINTGEGTNLGGGSTVLAINTWYHLSFAATITSTTVFSAKLFLNGALEASAVNSGTLPRTSSSVLEFSAVAAHGINASCWFDDLYVDDSSALTDPGDIRVTAKRPFANGTTNGFTTQIGSGGSGYGTGHAPQVNEQPLSTTNGWSMVGAGSAITEEYTIEGKAVGDVDMTASPIVDFVGWVYASSLTNETGSIVVAGASSNIALTNANTMFTKAAGSTTYPAGGTDIGIVTSTTVTTVSLYECGIIVAYTSVASAHGTHLTNDDSLTALAGDRLPLAT